MANSAINTPTLLSSRSSTAMMTQLLSYPTSFNDNLVKPGGLGPRHVSISNANSNTPSRRSSKSDFDNLLERSLLDLNYSGKSEVDSGAVSGLVSVGSAGDSGSGVGVVDVGGGAGGSGSGGGSMIGQETHRRRGSVGATRVSTTAQIDVVFMDYNMPRMVRVPPLFSR